MKNVHKQTTHFLIFLFFFSFNIIKAQEIWPGDVNNNGIVNNVDFIYIGAALGNVGPPRVTMGTVWEPHPFTLWGDVLFGADIDLGYADCNGDGIIDEADIYDVFYTNPDDATTSYNYGLTHGDLITEIVIPGNPSIHPTIGFEEIILTDFLEEGDGFFAHLLITLPEDFDPIFIKGLAFTVNFDPNLIDPFSTQLFHSIEEDDPENNTIESHIAFNMNNPLSGKLEFALTNIPSEASISPGIQVGNGELLAFFAFIIEDDLVGYTEPQIQSIISIEDIFLIDQNNQMTPAVGSEIVLNILNPDIVANEDNLNNESINIFPNPVDDHFIIDAPESDFESIEILNLRGQKVKQFNTTHAHQKQLDCSDLPNGIYILSLKSTKGILNKKIIIQH